MLESNQRLALITGGSTFELILPLRRPRFAQSLRASSGAPFGS